MNLFACQENMARSMETIEKLVGLANMIEIGAGSYY
jgi:hypothetical protein